MQTPEAQDSQASRTGNAVTSLQPALEDMTLPLTVVYAQTQLLHRRIESGRIQDVRDCLQALETIERNAGDLAERLKQAHQISAETPVIAGRSPRAS